MLSDNLARDRSECFIEGMKGSKYFTLLGLVLMFAVTEVSAADCLFAYKAKRDNPLQLHYGVIAIRGECSASAAKREASARLAANGWSLLVLLEQVESSKLSQYKETAGDYFLRY